MQLVQDQSIFLQFVFANLGLFLLLVVSGPKANLEKKWHGLVDNLADQPAKLIQVLGPC